jgi:hypothetical protein
MLETLASCKTHERDFTKYWYTPVSSIFQISAAVITKHK